MSSTVVRTCSTVFFCLSMRPRARASRVTAHSSLLRFTHPYMVSTTAGLCSSSSS